MSKSKQPNKSRPSAKSVGRKPNRKKKPVSQAELNRTLASGQSISLKPHQEAEELLPVEPPAKWSAKTWGVIALAAAVFAYSYLPTFSWMIESWQTEPDYGHGWFVIPLAIYLCFQRSASFPGASQDVCWQGLSLVVLAIGIRILSRLAYADFLDAYSMLPALAGAVWCLFGLRAMLWSLPAIGFLFFAIPLPYQAESALSWNLQGVATQTSTFFLRALGQPAVAEGHTVWIGQEKLFVEEACSGLRIFVGMAACAYFWAVLSSRHWSDRLVLVLAAIPAAIFVNAIRIVLIGLLYGFVSSPATRHFVHDLSGYLMIAASFALLGLVAWYWQKVYKRVPIMTAKETLRGSVAHS